MKRLKIGIYQMNMRFLDASYNHNHCRKSIEKFDIVDTDILVMPETWNLGFFPKINLKKLSYDEKNKTIDEMALLARKNDINIVAGSIINYENENVYNTSISFDNQGKVINEYNKIHLFSYMGEDKYFSPGETVSIFYIGAIKCATIICYDIRFTELVRYLALKGVQVLFVVAQWPLSRIEHWRLLNRCRAVENQIFVVAVNSCGKADEVIYGGNSMVIDPWGNVLCQLGENEEFKNVEINLEELQKIRNTINIYRDRKYYLYKIEE